LNKYLYIEGYIDKLKGPAARLNCVDREVLSVIYSSLLREFRNPYLTIEYLFIKSIDSKLAKMAIKKGDRVLNIGCGYPINEIIFHSWGIAERIVGIDVNSETIRKGQKWLNNLGINDVELYQRDALSLDFPRESFDVVVSFSAMEHVRGWQGYERWIENMSNIAKREIVLTTSNRRNIPLFLLGQLVRMEGYEHFFTPNEIENLLSRHGLEVTYFDTNTLWTMGYIPYLPGRLQYNPVTVAFDLLVEKLREKVLRRYGGRMGFIARKAKGRNNSVK